MSYRFFSVLFIFLCFTGTAFSQTSHFNKLKAKFNQDLIFAADYDHELTDSYTGEIITSTGKIWIGKGAYKLENDEQLLVVDGETSKVYDPNRNRVIIDEYIPEDDDFAPSRLLQGADSTFSISEEKTADGVLVRMVSEDDFAVFTKVEILLDEHQNPVRITAVDISENIIVTDFQNGKFIEVSEEPLFQLSYPEDAEIVDLRY